MRQVAGHPHAAAVVTAPDRLDHDRGVERRASREGIELVEAAGLDRGVARHRSAQRLQPPPHHQLVLGVHQGLRRRCHVDAFGDQLVQQFGRDVLVVEGQHVGSGRDPAQVFEIGVRADHHVGGDLRGRFVGGGGQHPQRLPQRDRGLVGHPGELTAADHRDQRGASGGRVLGTAIMVSRRPTAC